MMSPGLPKHYPIFIFLAAIAAQPGLYGCQSVVQPGAFGTAATDASTTLGPSGGTGAEVTDVLAGKYFWNSSGISIQGTMVNQGTWNENSAVFPGAGYYSGVIGTLSAVNVCSGTAIHGLAGVAVCESGTTVSPAAAGNVLAGLEAWNSSGLKITGTMVERGALDASASFAGAGHYNGTISNLPSASQIVSGSTVLGVSGSAALGDFAASNAYRADYSTVDLTSSSAISARVQPSLTLEATQSSVFTTQDSLVPDPKYATDGYADSSGIGVVRRNYLSTLYGRPSFVCGISGTIAQRISDCLNQDGTSSHWEGKNLGQGGEGNWKLVTAYKAATSSGGACGGGCKEVWRDEQTGLIWSDLTTGSYNWYAAAGFSSSSATVATTGYDARPASGTDCYGTACQSSPPLSACAEASRIANSNGVATYSTPNETAAKGNLSFTTSPTVLWRLPSLNDWSQASIDGIRMVLPNMGSTVWTSTSYSSDNTQGWLFFETTGATAQDVRKDGYSIRCVAGGER